MACGRGRHRPSGQGPLGRAIHVLRGLRRKSWRAIRPFCPYSNECLQPNSRRSPRRRCSMAKASAQRHLDGASWLKRCSTPAILAKRSPLSLFVTMKLSRGALQVFVAGAMTQYGAHHVAAVRRKRRRSPTPDPPSRNSAASPALVVNHFLRTSDSNPRRGQKMLGDAASAM